MLLSSANTLSTPHGDSKVQAARAGATLQSDACNELKLSGWVSFAVETAGLYPPKRSPDSQSPSEKRKEDREASRKRYLQLVRRLHPDRCGHPRAGECFALVEEAWRAIEARGEGGRSAG